MRWNRRRLPHHHLPALGALDPDIGVAAVKQLGLAVDDSIYFDLAGDDHRVVAVNLHVLDGAARFSDT